MTMVATDGEGVPTEAEFLDGSLFDRSAHRDAATPDEINDRSSRDDHGWEPPPEAADDGRFVLAISTDSERERREAAELIGLTTLTSAPVRYPEDLAQTSLFGAGDAPPVEVAEQEPDEIDHDWIGLPEFVPSPPRSTLSVSCATERDRNELMEKLAITTVHKGTRGTLSVWWPDRDRKDLSTLRFETPVPTTKEETHV